MKTIICERIFHKGEHRLTLRFPYDRELISITRSIPGARWSQSLSSWHIAEDAEVTESLPGIFNGVAVIDYSSFKSPDPEGISSSKTDERKEKLQSPDASIGKSLPSISEKGKVDIEKFRKWMEANRYPESTVRTYTGMITTFLKFVSPKEAEECNSEDLYRIVDEYIIPKGFSNSYQNQMISAVKKFYSRIYRSVMDPGEITRPRPQHRLPNVLSKNEVKKLLSATLNEKHRVMLSLIYACGLRRSELIELMISNVDVNRKLLIIRQSKGFKDRVVPISERTIEMVGTYKERFKPVTYLFEGQIPGKKYSASSLENVFRAACKKAGISKEITLHGLRHSYATHLLEAGTDLRYIQELLGHKSSRTTEIYTHVTAQSIQKIRSPFDDL